MSGEVNSDRTHVPAERRAGSLATNTVAQAVPKVLGYLLSFASAPIILGGLGLRAFGIWALTGAVAQYAALLDLGAGTSLARYIAACSEDRRLCGQYMAIGSLSVLGVGLVLGLTVLPAAPLLSHGLGGISSANMRIVLWAAVVLTCCSMTNSIISAYPIGLRRMVVPNVGIAMGAMINFIASVGAIALGAGLPGYALANAGAGLVSIVLLAVMVVRLEGRLPLSRPRTLQAREFYAFAIKLQLVRLMDLVNYQTDKIVIGFAVSPAAAGAYELANRVALAVRDIAVYATSAVGIELTTLYRTEGMEMLKRRYARLTEVAATLGIPVVLLTMALAPLLLHAWLGHVPHGSVGVLLGLCTAYLVAVSTSIGYALVMATGEPGLVARTASGAALANVILTVMLAPEFGLWGVLAGTVIALTGGALAQVVVVHRRYGLPRLAYTRAVLPALAFFGLSALPVAAIAYGAGHVPRGAAAVLLLGLAVAYMAVCSAWAARAGRLPKAFSGLVPGLRRLAQAP